MTTKTITITNSITLPKDMQAQWKNQEAVMQVGVDTIIIKRIAPPQWDALTPKLRKAGKRLTQKTIQNAVQWARAQTA